MNQVRLSDMASPERVTQITAATTSAPKHIAFSIKRISDLGGGAEKVMTEVANGLSLRGHRVTVICGDQAGAKPYYHLDAEINIRYLNSGNANGFAKAFAFLRGIAALRRAHMDCRPDVAVSFMHSSFLPVGMALLGTGIPLIASEHIGPEHYQSRPIDRFLLQLMPLLAGQITVVSEQIRASFNPWLRRNMVVARNPICFNARSRKAENVSGSKQFKVLLSVGRLTEQKNHACLIDAFGRIADIYPEWTLRIVGDGSLFANLAAQVAASGLTSRVELPGHIIDIGAEYENADLFVLPSRYESFGLVTAEAILHGLPVVGFADCPGTNELIRPGENGLLAEGNGNAKDLANTLSILMSNPEALKHLENAPTQWLQDTYALSQVIDFWERLALSYTSAGRPR